MDDEPRRPLDDEDREMLAGIQSRARKRAFKRALAWTMILVPCIPGMLICIFTLGALVGLVAGAAASVGWSWVVFKIVPIDEDEPL